MKNRPLAAMLTAVGLAGLVLSGCGSSDQASDDRLTIAASFYPLAFVAGQVAGDNASVHNLTQPGGEPHDLELTGRQVGQISDADLIVYLRGFQPSVDEAVAQNADGSSLDTAELVGLTQDEHEAGDHGHDHPDLEGDPHIWLDPANMERIADSVADRLADIDPGNADAYRGNADDLIAELQSLDEEYTTGLARCERDVIVVAHEAFGHLTTRYGLEQVGMAGLDPEAEPSPERLAEVQDVVTAEGVTTIFYERLVSPEVAETMAADLGVEAAVLDPIEGLTDDTAGEDYFSLMRANLDALRTANGCG